MKKNSSGFSLIELIIVITILGILSSFIVGNFMTSLKKGRDARRKADLGQIQSALEMYYEDNRSYPLTGEVSFGSSLSTAEKVYMQRLPNDPIPSNDYQYLSDDGTYYRLFSCIENPLDEGSGVSQNGYVGGPSCGSGSCLTCKYTISDSNSDPLTPN